MNAKQTAFLASHAAALPAAVTAPGLSAMIEALPRGRAVKALETWQEYATIFDAEERAIATLIRPRVIGGDGLFTLSLSDGRIVAAFSSCPTVKRCLEAVYSYAASRLPADCDPAEELDSYRESFNSNWFTAQASQVGFPVFRASSLTLAARWARRIALAWEAMGSPTPRAIGQEAPDCLCLECARPFTMGPHDVQICPACYPEERAEALARMTAAPFFGYPLAPTRAAPAPLWPVQPRRAFADLARVMGGR